jgi:hypothetical protein
MAAILMSQLNTTRARASKEISVSAWRRLTHVCGDLWMPSGFGFGWEKGRIYSAMVEETKSERFSS